MVRYARFIEHLFVAAAYAVVIVISLIMQEDDKRAANVLRSNLILTALMAVNVVWLAYHALLPAGICLLNDFLWLCKTYILMWYNEAYAVTPRSNVRFILDLQVLVVSTHFALALDEVISLQRE